MKINQQTARIICEIEKLYLKKHQECLKDDVMDSLLVEYEIKQNQLDVYMHTNSQDYFQAINMHLYDELPKDIKNNLDNDDKNTPPNMHEFEFSLSKKYFLKNIKTLTLLTYFASGRNGWYTDDWEKMTFFMNAKK